MLLNIALTKDISNSIHDIVDAEEVTEGDYDSAIFYSISSLETGLRGIDLGHRLIVTSCEAMRNELLNLKQYSSLSPVPGFRHWIEQNFESDAVRAALSGCGG